jgi:hypothetical protein
VVVVRKYRAVLDISRLGRRYVTWCGRANRLEGQVRMVEFDLPNKCELWEVEGIDIDSAWRTLEAAIGKLPVDIYQFGPEGHPDIVWPRTSRCEYGRD